MDAGPRPILFASLPESGLLNPLLILASELSRRAVDGVWFATDEPRRGDIEKLAVKTPVEFASLGEVIPELSALSWDDETYRAVTQASRFKAHRAVIKQSYKPALQAEKFRRLESVAERIKPALMVIDSTTAYAVDVAIAKKIPFVLSVPFLPSNVLASHNPLGKSYAPRTFPVPHSGLPATMTISQRLANQMFKLRTLAMFFNPAMGTLLAEDTRFRKTLGVPPPSPMTRVDAAELILCYSVAGLDYPLPIPDKMHLVGAMVPPLPEVLDDGGLTEWLSAQESVIYMGFGTITRLTREQVGSLVDVARRLDGRHQILWKLPEEQQKLLPPRDTLPGNLRIENWVPSQLDVLAHPSVKVFFNHGGGNGFNEGIYFGKPLVVRPLWVDCYDFAVRGHDFGVSLTLDRPDTFDSDDIVDKLTRVLDDASFRERAEHFGALEHAAGGRHAAADLLLGLPALAD